MERTDVIFDSGLGREFDEMLDACRKDGLKDYGDLKIVTKNDGTINGNPLVLLTFTVKMPGGPDKKVQTVTTAHNFITAALAVKGSVERYKENRKKN